MKYTKLSSIIKYVEALWTLLSTSKSKQTHNTSKKKYGIKSIYHTIQLMHQTKGNVKNIISKTHAAGPSLLNMKISSSISL